MKALAVIPAWNDAAPVPQLPLQTVSGVPLVLRTIQQARQSRLLSQRIIVTNDPQVAALARQQGEEVIQYSHEFQAEGSRDEQAAFHVLWLLKGQPIDVLLLVNCQAPFLLPEDIDGTILALEAQGADSALAAVAMDEGLWEMGPDGMLQRQASRSIRDLGAVYAMRVAGFEKVGCRLFGKRAVHLVDECRAMTIRSADDLYRARQLAGEIAIERQAVIYVDIDETICLPPPDRDYQRCVPIPENIARINRLYDRGHTVVYWTARGSRSGLDHRELTERQLQAWGARHHRLLMGKPPYDLLICDKAITRIPPG